MCNNQATYAVKTEYGTYNLCSKCCNNGHMQSVYQKIPLVKIPLGNKQVKCECEYYEHYE